MPVGAFTRFYCLDEERRAALQDAIGRGVDINGIDFLEVIDTELIGTPAEPSRQMLLLVQCFRDQLGGITRDHVRVDGGVRVNPVDVRWVEVLSGITAAAPPEIPAAERAFLAAYRLGELDRDRILAIGVDPRGDFSTYRFSLVQPNTIVPAAGFDPRLSSLEFDFKVECPSDFDCKDVVDCPPKLFPAPDIDYLAKDYASFRRLMLDRLSAIAPDWRERNPADVGIMLVELLAYTGDQLSYAQDAAATEAYLATARQRISVRRHARLVDYLIGEGVNARAWVTFEVDAASSADGAVLGATTALLVTGLPGRLARIQPSDLAVAIRTGAEFFESLTSVTLRAAHNSIPFYSWSNRSCCLPAGATRATLLGAFPNLEPGMFLLLEEFLGPNTGSPFDADPAKRHVVRLTSVEVGADPVPDPPADVTEIEWDRADALPFPLCLSSVTDEEHGSRYLESASVARGNVLIADHGRSVQEDLDPVPADPSTFRPLLDLGILVHAAPLPGGDFPAAQVRKYSAAEATPSVALTTPSAELWTPVRDLLGSSAFATNFVAEIENDGRARLRFGDEVNGRRPASGTVFTASYRVGVPEAGDVGAEAIAHIVGGPAGISRVRNALPAFGFRRPESLEQVRRYAPEAFRVQERAVTAADYAEMAERHPEVQRAAATFRWTGSWYTVFVSIDRAGGQPVDSAFVSTITNHLNRYRMAGFDLEIRPPHFVPLEIVLQVCVKPGYLRSDVKRALLEVFSNRVLAGGILGFFHSDNWTFGAPLYLSQIYEKAVAVDGVVAVDVPVFKRWARVAGTELADGYIAMGSQEIVRLDNDPSLRENGLLTVELEGGL